MVGWGFYAFGPLAMGAFVAIAVLLALPAALAQPTGFDGACYAMATLILIVGCWLAIGGLFLLYPAVLPLLLATKSLPMTGRPWPLVLTGLLIAFFALT